MRDQDDEDGGADADDRPRKRNHAVPVPKWWRDDARSEMRRQSITQMVIAARLAAMLGEKPSQSQISLCLKGRTTTLELVNAMSSILKLPPPVLIAVSRLEAMALNQERLRYREHMEAERVEAGIEAVERAAAKVRDAKVSDVVTAGSYRKKPARR